MKRVLLAACLVLAVLDAGCSSNAEQPAPHAASLRKGAEYLWSQQSEDGGWHSRTYGLLKSGQSLTPFVLEALSRVPDSVYAPPAKKLDRAFAFIRSHTDPRGVVGRMDPTLEDYPNYATALAVLAFCRAQPSGWRQSIEPMVAYLRAQQFTEQNGWQPRDPAYGAWGMGGERRTPPNPGHVDLSMTRYVLQALAATGVPASDPAFEKARVFLDRCQNYDPKAGGTVDGGFFFSNIVVGANKAGYDGTRFRSYGTATADGILALLATGCPVDDPRVQAAQRWLVAHHQPDGAPGFPEEPYRRWTRALRFYYAAAGAGAFQALHLASPETMAVDLEKSQRPDGSWVNPENLVKEDDPLIATALAIRALAMSSTR